MAQEAAFFTSTSQLLSSPGASNMLKTAAVAAKAVPPPWGPVLSAAIGLVGATYSAIADYRSTVIAYALLPLPKQYAEPALKRLASFGASEFVEALQSWIVYRSIGSGAKESAFKALRTTSNINDGMRTRLAKEIRSAVAATGAPLWMADHAAYMAAYRESRDNWTRAESEPNAKVWRSAVLAGYPPGTPESSAYADRLARWQKGEPQVGGQQASASGDVPWLWIGLAAAGLALVVRK